MNLSIQPSAFLIGPFVLLLAACGSSHTPGDAEPGTQPSVPESGSAVGFDPPPPPDGYTRIVAPVMTGLEPGSDVSHCQYVRAPADRDVDILDLRGFQSEGGHHAVAYATTVEAPVGRSEPCREEDNLAGTFLGGLGGEAGSGAPLPEGVVFRLPKGSAILLNTHFLNTTSEAIDGETVVDVLFAEADPNRRVASMFSNGNFTFEVPPGAAFEAVAECTMPRDMEFLLFANHMHDYGSSATTELVRVNTGEVELIQDDPQWTYEMQFNAVFHRWELDAPLTIHAGDTLRTRCSWQNDGDELLSFPREMCFGVGFFISDGSSSPVCIDGEWME